PPVSPVPAQLEPKTASTPTPAPVHKAAPATATATPVITTPPAAASGTQTAPGTPAAPGTATPAQQQAAIPQGEAFGKQHHDARGGLGMKQTTRVLVEGADGTTFINRTLNAGDSYMVPNTTGMTLTTADAGAVEIDLDGTSMGAAGNSGQIVETLSLDPQAIADRFNNRKPG